MRITELLAAIARPALIVVGAAASPAPAMAASSCVLGSPTVASAAKPLGITKSVTVKVTNCTPAEANKTGISWWTAACKDPAQQMVDLKPTSLGGNTYSYKGSYTDHPEYMANSLAGTYPTFVKVVRGSTTTKRDAPAIKLLRASRLTTSVFRARGYGSVANEGDHLEIYPWLERANWDTLECGDYKDTVSLQFRTKTGSYKTLRTSKDRIRLPEDSHLSLRGVDPDYTAEDYTADRDYFRKLGSDAIEEVKPRQETRK